MFKKIERKSDLYQITENFFVEAFEIFEDGEAEIDLWIWPQWYGIKTLLIGVPKNQIGQDCAFSSIEELITVEFKQGMFRYYEERIGYDERVEAEIEKYCNENP